jgi:hypothetical protein
LARGGLGLSSPTYLEFVALLRARGMIPASGPAPGAEVLDRPWFVALLQGVAGWLAGIFLLCFIGLMFKPQSTGAILAIGVLLLGGAWALYHADRNAVFVDQLALAISIAGQFAVAWAIVKDSQAGLPLAATMLGLQIVVLIAMPNKIARTLAALFATIAWTFTVRFLLQPGQGEEIFFSSGKPRIVGAWLVPAAWLLTWVPLLALAGWLVRNEVQWMSSGLRAFARPGLTGVLLGLSLGGIAADPFAAFLLGTQALGLPFSWWALLPLLSVALAAFAGYCAFRVRSLGLLGFAVLCALLHLSRFYYLYGTTLMWKSMIMLAIGALLLLGGVALRKHEKAQEGAA